MEKMKRTIEEIPDSEILKEFKTRFQSATLYGLEIARVLDGIGEECIKQYMKDERKATRWTRVTSKDQVKKGTKLKIIGFNPRDSIRCITVKNVIPHYGTEVILNKKTNLYFNLGAYLGELETVGRWVKELYYQEI